MCTKACQLRLLLWSDGCSKVFSGSAGHEHHMGVSAVVAASHSRQGACALTAFGSRFGIGRTCVTGLSRVAGLLEIQLSPILIIFELCKLRCSRPEVVGLLGSGAEVGVQTPVQHGLSDFLIPYWEPRTLLRACSWLSEALARTHVLVAMIRSIRWGSVLQVQLKTQPATGPLKPTAPECP